MVFITLSGIEGAGKTTQIRTISDYLTQQGIPCQITREPGGTPIGQKIRRILLDPANSALTAKAELLLYAADRAQHVDTVIRPALARGEAVLCDRFADCTTVFQGAARGLPVALIEQIHAIVLEDLKPDITFLLDLPAETGLARAVKAIENGERHTDESRFEKERLDFHEKVRAGYLAIARREPDRFRVIDASQPTERVADAIRQHLAAVIAVRKSFAETRRR